MNPTGLYSAWACAEILSGLIYRRRVDLKLELVKNAGGSAQNVTDNFIIPESEMKYLAIDAVNGSNHLSDAYFQSQSSNVQQVGQQRRFGT